MRALLENRRLILSAMRYVLTTAVSLVSLAAPAWATYWSTPVNVHPQTYSDDQFARLATPGGGPPWVIWLGADSTEGDAEIYYSRWNGDGWDAAALVNPPNTYSELSPRESEAVDGGLWVAWKAPNPETTNLYLGLASHWLGSAWSVPDTVWRDGGRYDVPSVAAVSQSEAWIVRDGYPAGGGDSDIYAYHILNGQVDSEYQFVQPDSDEVLPSITLNAAGTPWVVWYRINHVTPPYSLMWSSHLYQGSWTLPEQIPAPAGAIAPKIVPDASGGTWVVTTATDPSDPNVGQNSRAVWAIPNFGLGWGTPIRLNGPLGAPDSAQGQLSVSGGPGTDPRAIWIRFSVFSLTRNDLMTSVWNGTSWSTPERIGDLADSSDASWPDVAEYEGRIWATYNRRLKVAPFNQNVFVLHSLGDPTSAEQGSFDIQPGDNGILLRWSIFADPDPVGMRLYRSATSGDHNGLKPSIDALMIHEGGLSEAKSGEFLDTEASPGDHDYWLEVFLSPGNSTFIGPRSVRINQSAPIPPRITSAIPNPASGSILISGAAGTAGTLLEVFDVQGRRVHSIEIEGHDRPSFEIRWNGRTDAGHSVPSGIYFLRIRTKGMRNSDPRRILFLR